MKDVLSSKRYIEAPEESWHIYFVPQRIKNFKKSLKIKFTLYFLKFWVPMQNSFVALT